MNRAENAQDPRPIGRAARMRWPLIVTALLLTHAGALLLAVKIAQGDPSQNGNRVDPRYYERDARGASPDVAAPAALRESAPEAGAR